MSSHGWLWGEKSIKCKTSSIYKMLRLHILLTADLAFHIHCRLTLPAILIINVCWLITKEEVENTAGHHVAERSWVSSGLAWCKHHMSFVFHPHGISLLKAERAEAIWGPFYYSIVCLKLSIKRLYFKVSEKNKYSSSHTVSHIFMGQSQELHNAMWNWYFVFKVA